MFGLDDLVAFPRIRAHKSSAKLALTGALPRTPGVYLLCGRGDEVLYVGKAANVRDRVRAYFSGHDRRMVPHVVELTRRIAHIPCAHGLEASVRELHLIERHQPRFNTMSKARRRDVYLALRDGRRPRLAIVRRTGPSDCTLGPFSSMASARLARVAVERALPALAGGSTASVDDRAYAERQVRRAFDGAPCLLLDRLTAGADRDALARALRRASVVRALRRSGDLEVATPDGPVALRAGRLVLSDDDACDLPPHVVDDEILTVARRLAREGVDLTSALAVRVSRHEPERG